MVGDINRMRIRQTIAKTTWMARKEPVTLAAGNDCFSSAEGPKDMRAPFLLARFLPAPTGASRLEGMGLQHIR
jgi:hypothetical protein